MYIHVRNEGYFCDGTRQKAVPGVLSQKDAIRNGALGSTPSHGCLPLAWALLVVNV